MTNPAWLEASESGCGPGEARCAAVLVATTGHGQAYSPPAMINVTGSATRIDFCPFHAGAKALVLQLVEVVEKCRLSSGRARCWDFSNVGKESYCPPCRALAAAAAIGEEE